MNVRVDWDHYERERERGRGGERGRERERESAYLKRGWKLWVGVCVEVFVV